MTADLATSISLTLPELILSVGAMVILMIGVYAGRRAMGLINVLAVVLLAAAAIWLNGGTEATAAKGRRAENRAD